MAEQVTGRSAQRVADLVVLLVLASLVALYACDTLRASTQILNLILVLPVTVAVLVLCSAQFVLGIVRPATDEQAAAAEPVADVAVVIGLFVAYVLSLAWLGFDVGTCLFLGSFLWLHGERRLAWLLAYSIGFGLGLTVVFSALLPYRMPLLILGSSG